MILLSAITGAITYRLRGSGVFHSNMLSRLIFCAPMASIAAVECGNSWLLLTVVSLYAGVSPGWWGELDFTKPFANNVLNWLKLFCRGAWTLFPTFCFLAILNETGHNVPNSYWLAIAGAPMPFFYWLGCKLPKLPIGLTGGWEWGELLYGGWIGGSLIYLLAR